jgi:hypothetical protein
MIIWISKRCETQTATVLCKPEAKVTLTVKQSNLVVLLQCCWACVVSVCCDVPSDPYCNLTVQPYKYNFINCVIKLTALITIYMSQSEIKKINKLRTAVANALP